eukprot:6182412-Pleurochrysis_carterae.AAC.2
MGGLTNQKYGHGCQKQTPTVAKGPAIAGCIERTHMTLMRVSRTIDLAQSKWRQQQRPQLCSLICTDMRPGALLELSQGIIRPHS